MKLELKHYLDAFKYKVSFKITELGVFNIDLEYPDDRYHDTGVITDLSTYNEGKEISGTLTLKNGCSFDFDFKIGEEPEIIPCYRPLSDLTKEIEHNGEKFVPIDVLFKIVYGETKEVYHIQEYDNILNLTSLSGIGSIGWSFSKKSLLENRHDLIVKLHEWHFDTFGLIDEGLAIDINTLK